MSTASLVRWIALVASAELAVRGHLANHAWTCRAGVLLFAIALAALARPTRARRTGAVAAAAVIALVAVDAAIGTFAAPPQPGPASLRERGAGFAQRAQASRSPQGREAPAQRGEAERSASPRETEASEVHQVGERRPSESAEPAALPSAHAAPGATAVLVFAGRGADGQVALSPVLLGAALRDRLHCAPPLEVVAAGGIRGPLGDPPALAAALAQFRPALVLVLAASELLDDVIAESAALDLAPPEPIGPRGSRLGRALEAALAQWRRERAWRRALAAGVELDPRASRVVARYRELVLAARRADAEVALVIPPLALEPDALEDRIRAAEAHEPRARSWLVASRAHARSLRALAGSYGIRAIDTRPALGGAGSEAFADLGRLSAAGRERLAEEVADALSERLAHALRGCRPIER